MQIKEVKFQKVVKKLLFLSLGSKGYSGYKQFEINNRWSYKMWVIFLLAYTLVK